MSGPRVLVDATNLHYGGGVQVASSFINEVGRSLGGFMRSGDFPWLSDLQIEVSPAVSANLDDAGKLLDPAVVRNRPWRLDRWIPFRSKVDVSFVIFGPDYSAARARRRIVGYADVTSIYGTPRGVPRLKGTPYLKQAVRAAVSRRLLRYSDRIIVETDAFATAVRRAAPWIEGPIDVVPNCVNGALLAHCPVPNPPARKVKEVLYVARAYPHKNHEFLGRLGEELVSRGSRVKFLVTLTEQEWSLRSDRFRRHCRNLGVLKVDQLNAAYANCDSVIFPSLLEAYSTAPLEGMAMGRVVFASSRDFVRTTCGNGVIYIDPLCVEATADVFEDWLAHPALIEKRVHDQAIDVVEGLTTPEQRARDYLRVIEEELRRLV